MHQQATVRPSLSMPRLPIRAGVFITVLIGVSIMSKSGGTAGYLMLAGAGAALGVSAALSRKPASRWGVGLGVTLTVVCGGALWEQLWPRLLFSFFNPTPLTLLGVVALAHVCLWLGADRRGEAGEATIAADETTAAPVARWSQWTIALWTLVALQVVGLVLHAGSTRLPCSWLDPIRVAAGCQGAITSFAEGEWIEALTSTSQGVLVASHQGQTVRVRRADNGTLLSTITLPQPTDLINSVVSADGRLVLTNDLNRINVWSVADNVRLQPISDALTISEGWFSVFAVSPDGTTIATTSADKGLRLWRVSDGQLLRTLPADIVDAAAFSPDGALLATIGISRAELWRVADGTLLHTLDMKLRTDPVLSFSPDGQLLAVGGKPRDPDAPDRIDDPRRVIQVWRVADGAPIQSFNVRSSSTNISSIFRAVTGLAFTPDGRSIAAAISGDSIRLWRISDGTLLRTIDQAGGGEMLVVVDDGQTLLIDGGDRVYRFAMAKGAGNE